MSLVDKLNLSNITDMFSQAGLAKRGSSVLGIDIGSSAIKVVQVRKDKGTAVLETYGELSLGPYANTEIGRAANLDEEKLGEALRDILRESNVTTNNCGVSIPFASSLISLIELPAVEHKKLATMIPIEARKYIPVPISEVQLDWFVVPEGESKFLSGQNNTNVKNDTSNDAPRDKTLVLLVAIHNDVLRKYNSVLKAAELVPTFYEIEIFSSIRAVLSRGITPTVVLDIGAARTKLYIVEYGIVRTSHVINKGSQDITLALAGTTGLTVTKAEEMKRELGLSAMNTEDGEKVAHAALSTLEYIFSEAQRSVLAYQRRNNANVTQVVLTGGGSTLKGLLPVAEHKFEMSVSLGDPFSKVGTPAFLEEILKQAGPEFAVGVGLGLRKLQEL